MDPSKSIDILRSIPEVPSMSSQNLENSYETPSISNSHENANPFEIATQLKSLSTKDDDVPFLETPSIDMEIQNDYPKNKPNTSHMVLRAIRDRSVGRHGVSLQSIKQYIQSSFMVDLTKRNHLIKQCLVNGVAKGQFVQLSGQGANGSFRMANKKKKRVTKTKSGVSKRKTQKGPLRLKRTKSVSRRRKRSAVETRNGARKRLG